MIINFLSNRTNRTKVQNKKVDNSKPGASYNILIGLQPIILLILLIISSCSNPYKNLTSSRLSESEIKEIPYALPYSEKALIYKADISFYKNDIGGLLIIKKTNDNIYRIALTTQFGLKIFDFELDHGNLNVEYCVEYLNKKVILNTFQNDFNLLLMQNQFETANLFQNQNQQIWQFRERNISYNYIENTTSQNIENIHLSKRNSEKISVGLYSYVGEIPKEIKLEHHNIKLTMHLKLIN